MCFIGGSTAYEIWNGNVHRLTSATAVEVGKYSEKEGGRDSDGVSALL